MYSKATTLVIIIFLVLVNGVVDSADLAREKRLALEIVDSIAEIT